VVLPVPRGPNRKNDRSTRERFARSPRQRTHCAWIEESRTSDGQIAAIADVNELTLVTANPRDFRRFEGLKIEDWSR
jgi:predicted nucleic acid-binding protein